MSKAFKLYFFHRYTMMYKYWTFTVKALSPLPPRRGLRCVTSYATFFITEASHGSPGHGMLLDRTPASTPTPDEPSSSLHWLYKRPGVLVDLPKIHLLLLQLPGWGWEWRGRGWLLLSLVLLGCALLDWQVPGKFNQFIVAKFEKLVIKQSNWKDWTGQVNCFNWSLYVYNHTVSYISENIFSNIS